VSNLISEQDDSSSQLHVVVKSTGIRPPKLQIKLSTLLTLFSLTACVSFWFAARQLRQKELDRLLWLERSTGLPAIIDQNQMQVSPFRIQLSLHGSQGQTNWSVWVPYEEKAELCLLTENLDYENPEIVCRVMMPHGRHIISMDRKKGATSISINGQECFRREESSQWNLSPPWKSSLTAATIMGESDLGLLDAYGLVRLKPDEPFDQKKHRFGLRILVKPIRPWRLF
jgi:hypothetical protein